MKGVKVFQGETTRLLLAHPEVHGQSCRVLLYLASVVGWNNGLPEPKEVGEQMKINHLGVYRAYGELRKAGFIFKEGKVYYLNPMVGWKGTESGFQAACERLVGVPGRVRQLVSGQGAK